MRTSQEAGHVYGRHETNSEETIQMEISGMIVLAVGLVICAAAALFTARTASGQEGADRAADELPNTPERYK